MRLLPPFGRYPARAEATVTNGGRATPWVRPVRPIGQTTARPGYRGRAGRARSAYACGM
jgi:hypothetical protein